MTVKKMKVFGSESCLRTAASSSVFLFLSVLIYISLLTSNDVVHLPKPVFFQSNELKKVIITRATVSTTTEPVIFVFEKEKNLSNPLVIHKEKEKSIFNKHGIASTATGQSLNLQEAAWKNMQIERKRRLDQVCKKYGKLVKRPILATRYTFSVKHKLLYCRNAKVGTTTWKVSTFFKIPNIAR